MTDEPKYMWEVNKVKISHTSHNRSKHCQARRKEKNQWYIQPVKIDWKIVGKCSVCGATVEKYYI